LTTGDVQTHSTLNAIKKTVCVQAFYAELIVHNAVLADGVFRMWVADAGAALMQQTTPDGVPGSTATSVAAQQSAIFGLLFSLVTARICNC